VYEICLYYNNIHYTIYIYNNNNVYIIIIQRKLIISSNRVVCCNSSILFIIIIVNITILYVYDRETVWSFVYYNNNYNYY